MTSTSFPSLNLHAEAANTLAPMPESEENRVSKKPPRRTQNDRTREARDRLLTAAIEVLMEKGYAGLTTKEVATRSGLSNGALMHHFNSKAELVVAATAAVFDVSIERGQRVAKSKQAVKDPIEGFIADSLSVYFDWPFIAALEVIIVARTDVDLMEKILPVMQNYRNTTNELWLKVFREAGISNKQATSILNLTLNLVRGMAINRLWRHDDSYYKQILKEWVKLIKSTTSER
ncbi:TetR/AcrR family transcriptional regulator [Herbaspirillum chlorophenolicum]|uniref:TetR/AcrR family transcriptional regulator n=1 Tax=Herbaspirillum chlorophenolicum TaxID=211589 RepID=A0ABW8EYX9_9BURK|nr:TetR/AcrR family transcriptional regulator [Herbaspirillum chlorophenolicum]